jgi:hypothetical protein
LKGTFFDVPNKKNEVIENCRSSIADLNQNFIRRNSLCEESSLRVYEEYSTIYLFNYGNVQIDDNHVLYAKIDRRNNSLVEVFVRGSKDEMLGLAILLRDKYGAPRVETSFVENKLGQKFEKQTFIWTDNAGTRMTVESMYDNINEGALFIKSASLIEFERAMENREVEKFKSLKGNL